MEKIKDLIAIYVFSIIGAAFFTRCFFDSAILGGGYVFIMFPLFYIFYIAFQGMVGKDNGKNKRACKWENDNCR